MTTKENKKAGLIVGILVISGFVALLNETILNVALTAISQDLGVSAATTQWLITGYMLITSVMVPVTTFLYQSIPTKRLFQIAMSIVLVGTLGCLFAPVFPVLLASRMIQAMGTGMMIPIMMNTTLIVAPKEKLGASMALCVCGITLGPAFGPTLTGVMMNFFSWRASFVVLAVIIVIMLIMGSINLQDVAELTYPKLDIPSIILSVGGLAIFLYGISVVVTNVVLGVVLIIVGAVVLGLFSLRQTKIETPLLNLKPFKSKIFVLGLIMVTLAFLVNFSMNVLTPTYLQNGFGVIGAVSALVMLPGALLNALSTSFSGKILDKKGPKTMLILGFLGITVLLAILGFFSSIISFVGAVVLYILVFQALAFTVSPAQTSALAVLEPELNPHGVCLINTFMQIAASVGSSLFGGIVAAVSASQIAAGAATDVAAKAGYSTAMLVAAVFEAIGLVVAITFARVHKNQH